MIRRVLISFFLGAFYYGNGQMCPGGGVDFASAVNFDPGWIYGCTTGTSCNGGVHFDNRSSCEPTSAIDACAPAPSCAGATTTGSDIWFGFYPSQASVTLTASQNSSFVIGLQAFSGGPSCGALTSLGCAVAAGPSGGVSLALSGLVVGQRYYFRIFGAANNAAQRTGVYCLCGTTGLDQAVLTSTVLFFRASEAGEYNNVEWELDQSQRFADVELQAGTNGRDFLTVYATSSNMAGKYRFADHSSTNAGELYYRLRLTSPDQHIAYSRVISLKRRAGGRLRILSYTPGGPLVVETPVAANAGLFDCRGQMIRRFPLPVGQSRLAVEGLHPGIYFLRTDTGDQTYSLLLR